MLYSCNIAGNNPDSAPQLVPAWRLEHWFVLALALAVPVAAGRMIEVKRDEKQEEAALQQEQKQE